MFGRVRPSSSSLESLELERPPSKIIKDDSLSIYEATLAKLRQGSQRDLHSSSVKSMETDEGCNSGSTLSYEEAMTTDFKRSSPSVSSTSSKGISKEQENRIVSVICLFARYRRSQHEQAVMTETTSSSSSSSLLTTVTVD